MNGKNSKTELKDVFQNKKFLFTYITNMILHGKY